MKQIRLQFDYSDEDLVDLIANSEPPKGITVGKPNTLVKASESSGGIFSQVTIYFASAASSVILNMLASWLYERCKERGKKKGRVNGNNITYSKYSISLII